MELCLYLTIILFLAEQISSVPISDDYESNDEIEGSITPEPAPESPHDSASKYHVFTTRATWVEAAEQCHSKGYHLVNIESKEANDDIINAIKAAKQGEIGFWTSGNRINTNGKYFWGNGQPAVYTNWEHGVPDNLHASIGREEECIEIKGYNILKWNDHLCSYKLYYICTTYVRNLLRRPLLNSLLDTSRLLRHSYSLLPDFIIRDI